MAQELINIFLKTTKELLKDKKYLFLRILVFFFRLIKLMDKEKLKLKMA